ncbi:MAG: hypothetical protein K6G22_13450 [Lachnospiraceae bacterium]|nr:hypothetical protein [Lachnospiraceae bacterium]
MVKTKHLIASLLAAVCAGMLLTGCIVVNVNIYPAESTEDTDTVSKNDVSDIDEFNSGEDPIIPEYSEYNDANGWNIKYDPERFEITPNGPEVYIVYTGESAGTNMITVTYTVENRGKEAIQELGDSWGDSTEYYEAPFPGAEYATGYWAFLEPEGGGSGLYMTAIGRDYMDGALIFELTGHMGDDEEMNIEVSDHLAGIIDSLTWDIYSYDTIISYLSEDSYYAYADMDKDHDALLIARDETVFDNLDGNMASTEADVYGYDENGMIIYYGFVAGGGTATPLAAKDSELFYGGHHYMNKVHIDESVSEMIIDEGEYFDEYFDATVVSFTKAGE